MWGLKDYVMWCMGEDAEETEKFGLWAFGEHYRKMYPLELMKEWNLRHGDYYKCSPRNSIADDVGEMVAIYKLCKDTREQAMKSGVYC